jgi:hypothetical protein
MPARIREYKNRILIDWEPEDGCKWARVGPTYEKKIAFDAAGEPYLSPIQARAVAAKLLELAAKITLDSRRKTDII